MENLATIKLMSGEELIAQVKEGPSPLEITVINPVVVHKNNSALGPMLSVSHWLMFTKNNSAVIKKSKIVALLYDLEDNTIEKIEVKIGKRNYGKVSILDGLSVGDKIVKEGISKVRDKIKIRIIN